MILLIINTIINLGVLWHCMCSLNLMKRSESDSTQKLLKLFYVTLGTSSVFILAGPLYGYTDPQPAEIILTTSFLGISVTKFFISRHQAK